MRFAANPSQAAAPRDKVGKPASPQGTPTHLTLGFAEEAEWLGAGLRADGLHEIYAAAPAMQNNSHAAADLADGTAALGFALALAQLQRRQLGAGALIWTRESAAPGMPYGPGLAELGCDPAAITLLRLPDGKAVLRAGLDALRSGAATVLVELHGRQPLLDLTATRRLALAASETGTLALVVRGSARPMASAAHSRWQVATAPSAFANPANLAIPGHPAFALTLLRQRGGRDGLHIILEWDRDHATFQERLPAHPLAGHASDPVAHPPAAPLFGAVFAVATSRAGLPRKTGTGG